MKVLKRLLAAALLITVALAFSGCYKTYRRYDSFQFADNSKAYGYERLVNYMEFSLSEADEDDEDAEDIYYFERAYLIIDDNSGKKVPSIEKVYAIDVHGRETTLSYESYSTYAIYKKQFDTEPPIAFRIVVRNALLNYMELDMKEKCIFKIEYRFEAGDELKTQIVTFNMRAAKI